jgi:hypothetical protein
VSLGPRGTAEAPGIEGKDIKAFPCQDVHQAILIIP